MLRTPIYGYPFFQQGDLYSAFFDRERMVIADNQLKDLANIVGDGVLTGWTVCHSGPDQIEVLPGVGFINGIVNKTLSIKKATVLDNISTLVYMQSHMQDTTGGLIVETESPASNLASATFSDTDPPLTPTGFVAIAVDFDLINLFWDANGEADFDHYQVWRSTVFLGPYTQIASPKINGISPDEPFQDKNLAAATTYYYQLYTVDISGNVSAAALASATTLPDTRKPAEVSGLTLYPSNTTMSMIWNASASPGAVYRLTAQALNPDGSNFGAPLVFDDLTTVYWQVVGLTNNQRYRILVQAKNPTGVLSDGLTSDGTPTSSVAPLDALLDTGSPGNAVVPLPQAAKLTWLASPSPTGSAIGQKKEYRIRVILNGIESAPIKFIGTALTKTVVSYNDQAAVGEGLSHQLQDNTVYGFRITTLDVVGNESVGLVVKGSILDTTPPNDPRQLQLVAGDTTVLASWKHSSSTDVVGYVVNIDSGLGFGPDIDIDYLTKYLVSGLTNGVLMKFKIRAKDRAGNISSPGIISTSLPTLDTIPPAIPTYFRGMGEDSQVVLQWKPDTEPDLDHYVLKRVAVAQDLNAVPGKNLTEITEIQKSLFIGNISEVISTLTIRSDDLAGLPDITGDVFVVTSGVHSGVKGTIVLYNTTVGEVTFSSPLASLPAVGDMFSIRLTHPSLGTSIRNVGLATNILDIGLLNGQTYAYSVQAVDQRGNASNFSNIILVAPNCGLNDLNAPTNLLASFSVGTVTLTWNQIVPTPDHPAFNHTAFNVYRSTSQFTGFTLIDSVPSTVLTDTDTNLVNGITYYYIVTAVRDDADVLIDTGAIQPPNTVLLATVKINLATPLGCEITAIENQQRLVDNLNATIFDATNAALLAHKHRVKPLNANTVTAVSLLATIDATALAAFDFTTVSLSPVTQLYYNNLINDPTTGKAIPYDRGTTFFVSPSSVNFNVPFVGDFQVLLNGSKPVVEFSIDHVRNAVVFPTPLATSVIVTLDGTGFSYYVPAQIDLGFQGFDIQVNGVNSATPSVDEALQTIRFMTPLLATDVVTVIIDPVTPDFGTQQGARQVSLNPDIVLNDFTTANGTLFKSASGAFDSTDTFFVLVDNVRTTSGHVVDTRLKTITFDTPVDSTSTVSLQILNREEVQGLLPISRIGSIEASQFKTGTFLKAQLPPISHDGRVSERCLPIFQVLTTADKYVYQAGAGIVGSATTPYAVYQFPDGTLLIGTSIGLLLASGFAAFNSEGDSSQTTVDYSTKPPPGLKFMTAAPDQIVNAAKNVIQLSGRFNGDITIPTLVGGIPMPTITVQGPNIIILDDLKILISGGAIFNENIGSYFETTASFIYDPVAQVATQVGGLNVKRRDHAGVLLPNGNVLVCGGSQYAIVDLNQQTGTPNVDGNSRLTSSEIFDVITKTWSPTEDMQLDRDLHACILLNGNEVLVAGGNTGGDQYNGLTNPPQIIRPKPTAEAEIYNIGLGIWTVTTFMNRQRVNPTANADSGVGIVGGGGQDGRELFRETPVPTWTFQGNQSEAVQNSISNQFGLNSIDGPVKQFLADSFGFVLLVSRNNVYVTQDGQTFLKTKGLDSVGVVHRIAQDAGGTLYAATDLGVYEITPDIHAQFTWFQGGLIGQGTTETFDLQAFGAVMLAATEIGIFSTSDSGNTWTQLVSLNNVFNIEAIATVLFANSNQDVYRSDDAGSTWKKITTLDFIDENAQMVARAPLDLFFATGTGLYATKDGINFFLVDFERNRHPASNNVHMAQIIGSDLLVGFDNEIISVGPAFENLSLAQFVGIVPTVLVNGVEIRNGFRFDTKLNQVVFEVKRFVNDEVEASSNYGVYEPVNGPWYAQNADPSISVYINGAEADDANILFDSRLGQISFTTALTKTDFVTVSIAGTTLLDGGQFFHNELEDKFEQSKGLPLSLGRDYSGNILQMGISVEHNFQERGIERNQYYCSQESLVDRGFTSFLENAEFYIMGRRQFDRFNSTIDYNIESEQLDIGTRSLVPLSALEVSPNLWIGTENGIFVLSPTAPNPFSIVQTIAIGFGNAIRDMQFFQGDVWLATQLGLFETVDSGVTFIKNEGNGLPSTLLRFTSIGNTLLLGTNDTIYYSDGLNQDPAYSIWFRANFVASTTSPTELIVNGACNVLASSEGIAYAGIGRSVFLSVDGKTWQHVFDFGKTFVITSMAVFARKLYVGTNQGVYNDDGSARSNTPSFRIENTEATPAASAALSVNDMFVHTNGTVTSLYVVGNTENVYTLTNEAWTRNVIPGTVSIQKFIIVAGPKQVAMANDKVFVQ